MWFRVPACEEWRPAHDLTRGKPGDAAGLRNRKVWHAGVLLSTAGGSEQGEMALWALETAPISAAFSEVFDDLRRDFPYACR
jgi:hypothetical protein